MSPHSQSDSISETCAVLQPDIRQLLTVVDISSSLFHCPWLLPQGKAMSSMFQTENYCWKWQVLLRCRKPMHLFVRKTISCWSWLQKW